MVLEYHKIWYYNTIKLYEAKNGFYTKIAGKFSGGDD